MSAPQKKRPLWKFWNRVGPGFVTGASDDDPSGILTYSQTGAVFGYRHLWTTVLTIPFMTVVQEMCGRIGMVTGRGLGAVLRQHYAKPVLYIAVLILFSANAVNIGADLGAMAASLEHIAGGTFRVWLALVTLLILLLEIFIPYRRYSSILKYLTLSLFAYVLTMFLVEQDWSQVLVSALLPTTAWTRESLVNVVAVFGTTISPYLFFWQTSEEVEEAVLHGKIREPGAGKPKVTPGELKDMRIDTLVGMVFSNVVAFFVIMTAASTLHPAGITDIETAADAAKALEPIAGPFASLLFTVGIIGTGLLAVPVLAGSAGYAVADAFGWKASLERSAREAPAFYAVIGLSMLIGVIVNAVGVSPFKMLYYTAILNGVSAPPLLLLILLIANNEKIMGNHVNGRWTNLLGFLITMFMTVAVFPILFF